MATAAKPRASAVKEVAFLWEGKNKDGKLVRGEMRAASESVVQAKIRRQGITNTKVKKVRFKSGSKITEKDIALFTRQLATMNDAGVPLLRALQIIQKQEKNKVLLKKTTSVSVWGMFMMVDVFDLISQKRNNRIHSSYS